MGGDLLVKLARGTIERYVQGEAPEVLPERLPSQLAGKAGVFVSLKKGGQLRGCIGTVMATKANLAEEIMATAVKAATQDPRFAPVRSEELGELVISVDVLSPFAPVVDLTDLDPQVYGVLVRKGHRSGLLLPDLDGVDSWQEQIAIARAKAGIEPEEKDLEVYRFTVERHV